VLQHEEFFALIKNHTKIPVWLVVHVLLLDAALWWLWFVDFLPFSFWNDFFQGVSYERLHLSPGVPLLD